MSRNTVGVTKIVLNWKPERKRPSGRSRNKWMDVIEKDLENLGAQNWREIVQDRYKWSDLVMKLLENYKVKKKKKKILL